MDNTSDAEPVREFWLFSGLWIQILIVEALTSKFLVLKCIEMVS